MNLTDRPIYQKGQRPTAPKRKGKDAKRLARVSELPCVICQEYGLPQLSPTQVHHCIHGRNSMGRKAPDCMTIPLCEGHHQGDFDTSKTALHRQPQAWKEAYGLDTDWLSWVEYQLARPGGQALAVREKCAATGCEKRVFAGEYCGPHYRRALRHGDPLGGGTSPGDVEKWLKDHADHEGDDCLFYPFSSTEGYHSVSLGNGKWSKAHRIMCGLRHGPAPEGAYALHSCHNKSCVNPNHLRWGTPAENTEDASKAGRLAIGEATPMAKLTEDCVRQIRHRWEAGEKLDAIAADYPATRSAIWLAAKRRTWRHVK